MAKPVCGSTIWTLGGRGEKELKRGRIRNQTSLQYTVAEQPGLPEIQHFVLLIASFCAFFFLTMDFVIGFFPTDPFHSLMVSSSVSSKSQPCWAVVVHTFVLSLERQRRADPQKSLNNYLYLKTNHCVCVCVHAHGC